MGAARQLPKSRIWDTISVDVSNGQSLGILFGQDGNLPDVIIQEVKETSPFLNTDLKAGDRIKIINEVYTEYTDGVQMLKSAIAEGTVKITVMHTHR